MQDRELAFTPAWKQAQMVAAREISPSELVDVYLRRIEAIDPQIGAYITVAIEQARDEALEADVKLNRATRAGTPLPPLFGVPVSIKDIESTRGLRTTMGSRWSAAPRLRPTTSKCTIWPSKSRPSTR